LLGELPPLLAVVPPVLPLPPLLVVVPPVLPLPPLPVVVPPLAPPLDAGPVPPPDAADLPPDDELFAGPESVVVRWQAQTHATTPHKTSLVQNLIRMFPVHYPRKSDHVDRAAENCRRRRPRDM
jgi:hypothetical protein